MTARFLCSQVYAHLIEHQEKRDEFDEKLMKPLSQQDPRAKAERARAFRKLGA